MSSSRFAMLPNELLLQVAGHLSSQTDRYNMCLTPKRLSGVAQEVLFRFPNANASRTGKESQIALLLRTLTQMLYLREKVRGIHLQPSYGGCRTDANFIIPTALPHSPTIGRSILTSELCVTLALLSFTTRLEVLALDTSPAAWRNLFDPSWHSPDGQGFTQVGRAQIVQALPRAAREFLQAT
jgi:hypothetical protein